MEPDVCPRCDFEPKSYKSLSTHYRHNHPNQSAFLDLVGAIQLAVDYEHLSKRRLAEKYGVSRDAVDTAFEKAGIKTRGQSEAAKMRAEQNPDFHSSIAHLGTEARERNGMKGRTGQDSPSWRGGKSIYDAVKKQLPVAWRSRRNEAKRRDGNKCVKCGASDCKLDSHHIVPIMCGGTHGFWNLMTLCESCHTTVESYTRECPEISPVLVE